MADLSARDRLIGTVWLLAVVAFLVAVIAGLVQVLGDRTAEMGYRWAMAVLFIGASLGWLTSYYADPLRRFFRR